MIRDLVCGVSIEADHALRVNYHGKPYYFCSHDCKVNFEDRPDEYLHLPTHHAIRDMINYPLEVLVTALRADETAR
jgi:YHS domain-containing protein